MRKRFLITLAVMLSGIAAFALPRPEYPRPQFERSSWVNLNGEWTYSFDFGNSGIERAFPASKGFDGKIIVPFAPESKLSGVEYKDFINHIWYQRNITVPAAWEGKRVMLNFGAVYFNSEVYIDGVLAGRHFGGSSSFSMDITSLVKAGATHSLVVKASSDVRSGMQSAGKQSLRFASHDCDYTRTTGIWQTVWMEAVAKEGLSRVHVVTDIDQSMITVQPQFFADNAANTLKVIVKDGSKVVAEKAVKGATANTIVFLPIKKARLWSPEDPFLYDVSYQVLDASGAVIDEVSSYVGMRKVHIEGNKVFLNNVPYYQRLVLDQGFYPDGIWTAPSDEALRHDIELSMAAGFNGARLHQKVFEERFHYWADRLGYLTWAEAPSWGMDANDIEVARNFLMEWSECVIRDRNHPDIVTWTPMNEEFWPDGLQYARFNADLYDITKSLDPTRPVNTVSGGVHYKTDLWTVHHYEQNPKKLGEIFYNGETFFTHKPSTTKAYTKNQGYNVDLKPALEYPLYDGGMPYIVDEFGGIKWVKGQDAQTKNSKTESWGYGQAPASMEEFYARLEGMVDVLLGMSDKIWGYCYTQLTDVEIEQNGIYFYDRSSKFDMNRIHAIFSKTPESL